MFEAYKVLKINLIKVFSVLFIFSLLSASLANAESNRGNNTDRVDFWLTVLHNNDGESQLINAGSGIEDFGGIARFATLVEQLRDEAIRGPKKRLSLLLSSGDNFLAGPELNASFANGVPFFDSVALDKIGYDALAIGNHEFDFGPDVLQQFILGFENIPPFVSANLDFSGEPGLQALVDDGFIVKSTVIRKRGEEIGIVGATTPDLPFISSPRNTVVLNNVAGLVQNEIDNLTNSGINKIIFISHLQGVDEDLALAPLLSGVDIMIAGGGDELLANPGDLLVPGDDTPFGPYPLTAVGEDGKNIPVVTTPGNYRYVGRLTVAFNKKGEVIDIDDQSGLVRVAGGDNPDAVEPDAEIQSMVVEPVQAFIDELALNVISETEVDLEGRRSPGLRTMETNLGNLVADSQRFRASQLAGNFGVPLPDVAFQNGGGIRIEILFPAGNITELDTFDILPFLNFVALVPNVTREQFKELMEHGVSSLPSANGRFPQISGFTITVDTTGTAQQIDADGNVILPGNRITELTLDNGTQIVVGGVVQPGPNINIATIDFLANGGDGYPFRGITFTTLGSTYQQALFNFLTAPSADGGLGGIVSAADYPEGGEGRITILP